MCGAGVCGGGHGVMTMSLAIPSHGHAANKGGRTPGSQTPGVPATPEPSTTNCWLSRAQKKKKTSELPHLVDEPF